MFAALPMSQFGPSRQILQMQANCRVQGVVSTGRRNTCIKSFCWGFNSQGFTWPFVELTHHLFRWACEDTDNRLSSKITEYTPSFHLRISVPSTG